MPGFRGSTRRTDEWSSFETETDQGVLTITFSRPDRLNALTIEAYADLRDLLTEAAIDGELGAVIVRGRGRGFCAGGDVNEIMKPLRELGPRELVEFTTMTGTVVRRMRELPVPVIAAVNGIAAGAGAVLALAADFRVFSESGSLAFVFAKAGLSGGDMGAAYLLPRMIGVSRATELLMLGDRVTAQEAQELGLAHDVVADERLDQAAAELARRLATGPRFAHAATKRLLGSQLDTDLSTALELDGWSQALLIESDDHAEFQASYAEKRDPKWRGS